MNFKKRIETLTKKEAHLSGSGSTFFILYSKREESLKAAEALRQNGITTILSEFI